MEYKTLNSYIIRHKNGECESINAETASDAVSSAQIPETDSKIDSLILTGEDVRVAVPDEPTVATFAVEIDNNGFIGENNNKAYPESVTAHIGDKVKCSADIDDRFNFDGWYKGDIRLSTLTEYEYTIQSAEDTLTARFKLAPVSFSTRGEGGGSSIVFPDSMTVEANAQVKLLAVPTGSFIFWKWTRNGVTVSESAQATITVLPRQAGETIVQYVAHFQI